MTDLPSLFDMMLSVVINRITNEHGLTIAHDMVQKAPEEKQAEMLRAIHTDSTLYKMERQANLPVRFYVLQPKTIRPVLRVDACRHPVPMEEANKSRYGQWSLSLYYLDVDRDIPACHEGGAVYDHEPFCRWLAFLSKALGEVRRRYPFDDSRPEQQDTRFGLFHSPWLASAPDYEE